MPGMVNRRKQRLGRKLKELRNQARTPDGSEVTLKILAKHLKRGESHLSKCERGASVIAWGDLLLLLQFYGFDITDEAAIAPVVALWEDANLPTDVLPGGSALPEQFRGYLRLESDADFVLTIERCVIPGLLQIDEYAEELRKAARRVGAGDQFTLARHARQQVLTRSIRPLRLRTVIDEAAIRRVVGGIDVMMSQLDYLLSLNGRPNIIIQVMPELAGAYGTSSSSVAILGFDDPEDTNAVYIETEGGGGKWYDAEVDTNNYMEEFEDVAAKALNETQSFALIGNRRDELGAMKQ